MSIADLVLRFWQHAQQYYRHADGTPTSEVSTYKPILKLLRDSTTATRQS